MAQPFGYTGYQQDRVGGMYFAQARRYDARAGRFVSEDMHPEVREASFTLNRYNYCWNSPMNLVDLNGLWASWVENTMKVAIYIPVVGPTVGNTVGGLANGLGSYITDNLDNIDNTVTKKKTRGQRSEI